jgi:hypothetical protein
VTGPGGLTGERPGPSAGALREWHAMSDTERAVAWAALVDWVIWIHDLYELSREERLPLCWPRHPGLVEELRSLKTWRDALYSGHDRGSSPHAARSWHGELRQSIAAAGTFWAPACRAGHTDAVPLRQAHPHLAERWHDTGPPVMGSCVPNTGTPDDPTEIDANEMAEALTRGDAQQHSSLMPHYVQWGGAWWTRTEDGRAWLRCVDPAHHAQLDETSVRMRAADTARDRLHHQ